MELTRQADYAIRCVLETAKLERTSAAEIARNQGLSPSFVGKIVSTLAHAGLLETRRGATGGVRLARDPATISVLEVVEAAQGPIQLNRCVRRPPSCELIATCPLSPVIRIAQQALIDSLSVTLDELLAGNGTPAAANTPPTTTSARPATANGTSAATSDTSALASAGPADGS